MQGCILNVLGGGLLGIGTLFNLLLNGFVLRMYVAEHTN